MLQRTAAHRIVIGHLAAGVQTARARARIHAALVDARPVQIALGAGRALRPACWRQTDVVRLARAHRMRVDVATLAVRAARRRHARIGDGLRRCDADLMAAGSRWVAGEAGMAAAVRRMIGDMALGIGAADAGARIVTLLVATRPRLRAVRVHDALRSAFGVRIAKVLGQAGARAGAVALLAHGVDAARRRIARFDGFVENGWVVRIDGKID